MVDAQGNRYGPYDIEVPGSEAEALTEDAWYDLFGHISGVKTDGGPITFTGLTAHLPPIDMRVHGSFLSRDDEWTDASPPTSTAAPRRDMLVARRQLTTGEGTGAVPGKTFMVALRGTPAAPPAEPTDYNPTTDEPLWSWQVPGNGGTVITGQRDLRRFLDPRTGLPVPPALHAYRSTDQSIAGGVAATGLVGLNATKAGGSPDLTLDPATNLITVGPRAAGPLEVSGALGLIQDGAAGAAAPGLRVYVAVLLNGVPVARGEDKTTRGALVGDLHGRVMPTVGFTANEGDTIGFRYFHDSSAGAKIAPGSDITHLYVRSAV